MVDEEKKDVGEGKYLAWFVRDPGGLVGCTSLRSQSEVATQVASNRADAFCSLVKQV